jgi:hypothetical protein
MRMHMNCHVHSKMIEEVMTYPASQHGKGNVKNKYAKPIVTSTPNSRSGPCMRAVLDEAGEIIKIDGEELWV